jgi:pyruvate formate lyase activating enzyme
VTTGRIFNIQRFSTHDGPGIRTVVFFKGCPLRCDWCHNPESQGAEAEVFYSPNLCCGCRACAQACPQGAHRFEDGRHVHDRARCVRCLRCGETCPAGALEPVGRTVTVAQVLADICKDRVFFEESRGGLTLSGGEPAFQPEFALALLRGARDAGIATCVETSGCASAETFRAMAALTDLFLWDVKDTDAARHLAHTGVTPEALLDNLRLVDRLGAPSILRCILLKGVNLEPRHLDRLAAIFHELRHCSGVELLPYQPLGQAKAERLGRASTEQTAWEPDPAGMEQARHAFRERRVPLVS